MTPGARLAAAIEILAAMEADGAPADQVAGAYLRARRYIGAKDRKAISERVWGCLRRRARLDWWLDRLDFGRTPRHRLLADLALADRLSPDQAALLFTSVAHGPGTLAPTEWALLQALKGRDLFHHDMPDWVKGEYPAWLEEKLAAALGARLAAEMGALRDEAPVDLRVNGLKTDRETARQALAADGLEALPTRLSPVGLRLPARAPLAAQSAFRQGWLEVQDEGSQLVALLADARPGQTVADYCAGAGGKTLAMAASMANKGRLVALDIHKARAERAGQRLRRAGVHNVTRRLIDDDNARWLQRQAGSYDRVLVDAPCSGSGTWRRNPDARWRLTAAQLDSLQQTQTSILDQASRLVKPGGRLIYATCSLLLEENERQVEAFLQRHPDFTLLPIADIWAAVIGEGCPAKEPVLRLTPASDGTDGFFCAVLQR